MTLSRCSLNDGSMLGDCMDLVTSNGLSSCSEWLESVAASTGTRTAMRTSPQTSSTSCTRRRGEACLTAGRTSSDTCSRSGYQAHTYKLTDKQANWQIQNWLNCTLHLVTIYLIISKGRCTLSIWPELWNQDCSQSHTVDLKKAQGVLQRR